MLWKQKYRVSSLAEYSARHIRVVARPMGQSESNGLSGYDLPDELTWVDTSDTSIKLGTTITLTVEVD